MKRTIRRGVFETNSSSTHSLTIRKMTKNENNVIDDDASFEIRSPLPKAIQILGLIDNAERDYKSYVYYLDEDEDTERGVAMGIAERVKKISPEALNGYDIKNLSYSDLSEIFLKLIENHVELYDFFEKNEAPYSLAFTVYNRNRAVVKRFAVALLAALAKMLNITVEQVGKEIEHEAFGNSAIREILKDESTAEVKLKEYVQQNPDYNRFTAAYKKSGEADIVSFAKKFYVEDFEEIKKLSNGRISCEMYFCNGCLNDCNCGFESYYDIEEKLGLDFYMTDEQISEIAKSFLTSSKFVAKEYYSGLLFEKTGEIF